MIVKRIAIALLFIAAAGCHRYQLTIGQWLWRLDGTWTRPPNRQDLRIAPATILVFRPDHEYVELHCWVIERADETVYIASNSPRITVVGQWQQKGGTVDVTRKSVGVSTRFGGSIAPFCAPMKYRISGQSVSGDASGRGEGLYAPVTRLVAPDFEYYVKEARNSPAKCPGASN